MRVGKQQGVAPMRHVLAQAHARFGGCSVAGERPPQWAGRRRAKGLQVGAPTRAALPAAKCRGLYRKTSVRQPAPPATPAGHALSSRLTMADSPL